MNLTSLCSCVFFAAVKRLQTPEKATQAAFPPLESDLLSDLSECLWLSQTQVLPIEQGAL